MKIKTNKYNEIDVVTAQELIKNGGRITKKCDVGKHLGNNLRAGDTLEFKDKKFSLAYAEEEYFDKELDIDVEIKTVTKKTVTKKTVTIRMEESKHEAYKAEAKIKGLTLSDYLENKLENSSYNKAVVIFTCQPPRMPMVYDISEVNDVDKFVKSQVSSLTIGCNYDYEFIEKVENIYYFK